ncbi:DUF3078 domain-containing protein [Dysgonomonas sp. HGC4]|uniref:DUF3078 domain-containing protein n=1 Tax=Dysgonomonas sp. HGC4 TaxID=1658009 RepID=UPI0006834EA0|nr:DUF3078 domain-containing protein [Dysgonomonas sp. HGC4]MBD8348101.1 DUF3078 domain-containing protein [Dysgonomonas sp. HGC4]
MKNSLFYILASFMMSLCTLASRAEALNLSYNEKVIPAYKLSEDDRFALNIAQKSILQNDSALVYTRGTNGLIIVPPVDWDPFPYNVSFRDTVIYDRLFLPVVFDGKILPPRLDFIPQKKSMERPQFRLIPEENTFAPLIKRAEEVQARRRNFYMDMSNIGDVRYNASVLKSIPKLKEEDATKRNFLHDLIATDEAIKVTPIEMEKIDPGFIYWVKTGNHALQVAQNYITHNWSRGGNSSFFIRNDHRITVNYAKDKITFNNILEWRLNLQATPSDELHDVNISEDLFRLENILGYKAYNNWSYSARLETKTPFFQSYPLNSKDKTSSFLAPFMANISVGMGYKLDKKFESDKRKTLNLTFNLSPLSLNYIYVRDKFVDEKRFGLEEGERTLAEFGSLVSSNLDFRVSRYVTWTSRFKYFTNYERVEVEFENVFTMLFTRLLSTTVSLNTRFDDNVPKGGQLGYFQVNQLVSFGLNYKW